MRATVVTVPDGSGATAVNDVPAVPPKYDPVAVAVVKLLLDIVIHAKPGV